MIFQYTQSKAELWPAALLNDKETNEHTKPYQMNSVNGRYGAQNTEQVVVQLIYFLFISVSYFLSPSTNHHFAL